MQVLIALVVLGHVLVVAAAVTLGYEERRSEEWLPEYRARLLEQRERDAARHRASRYDDFEVPADQVRLSVYNGDV